MSDSSRFRDVTPQQRRLHFRNPIKKNLQFRIVLKPTSILIDVFHSLPPDMEALVAYDVRGILDSSFRYA
jgi:hypothetical protein